MRQFHQCCACVTPETWSRCGLRCSSSRLSVQHQKHHRKIHRDHFFMGDHSKSMAFASNRAQVVRSVHLCDHDSRARSIGCRSFHRAFQSLRTLRRASGPDTHFVPRIALTRFPSASRTLSPCPEPQIVCTAALCSSLQLVLVLSIHRLTSHRVFTPVQTPARSIASAAAVDEQSLRPQVCGVFRGCTCSSPKNLRQQKSYGSDTFASACATCCCTVQQEFGPNFQSHEQKMRRIISARQLCCVRGCSAMSPRNHRRRFKQDSARITARCIPLPPHLCLWP